MLGGWLMFAHVPDRVSLAGMVLIAVCGAAGAWLTVRERRPPIEPAESWDGTGSFDAMRVGSSGAGDIRGREYPVSSARTPHLCTPKARNASAHQHNAQWNN
jgi:hypothetical protein